MPARGKSPGRPPAQQDSQSDPPCPTRVPQALWYYWVLVWRWMYGNLLPTLTADKMARLRTSYLKVLDLDVSATPKQIEEGWKRLNTKLHPDKNIGKDAEKLAENAADLIEINNAHDFLVDPLPLDVRQSTDNFTTAILQFILTMLVLTIVRLMPLLGGDVLMMNPITIEFFGRTYAQWPSLMSIISSTVITYCMGGILVFPTVMILREYVYICSTIKWVLMYIAWCPAWIAKHLPWWISWCPSIFTWLFTWIIWMIMIVLENILRFCDNWWTFHFIPIGPFFTVVWTFGIWLIHTLAFYNKYNPSQAIVLSNVLLIFGLIAVMGVLLVWARM